MAGSEAELSLVLKAKNLASREVDKLHGSFVRAGRGVKSFGRSLETLAKIGVIGLITGLVAAIGFLGVATKAAADEQKGIVRLDAALRANVKGFKGNTTAIEALIAKREGLGFSDDKLRDSLTFLVTKYHNVNRAQRIQAVAMDLARQKNIDLQTATVLVSKGMDGSAKALKQLGIVLPKTATEHERLAAIQKKVAGQAEAYGKTAAGSQEAFQIAIADVVEDIGAGLLPIMTQAFTWLRTEGIPAVRGIIGAISKWMNENKPLITQIRDVVVKVIGMAIEKVKDVVTWIGKVAGAIASNKDAMNVLRTAFAKIAEAVGLAWAAISTLIGWVASVVSTITSNRNVIRGFATVWNILGSAVNIVVDAFRWLLDNAGKVIDTLSHLKLPDITGITNLIPHFAAGGKVPGSVGTPSLAVVHGQERISRPGPGDSRSRGAVDGVTLVGVTERQILDMVDRGLYFRLQRSAPTQGRT